MVLVVVCRLVVYRVVALIPCWGGGTVTIWHSLLCLVNHPIVLYATWADMHALGVWWSFFKCLFISLISANTLKQSGLVHLMALTLLFSNLGACSIVTCFWDFFHGFPLFSLRNILLMVSSMSAMSGHVHYRSPGSLATHCCLCLGPSPLPLVYCRKGADLTICANFVYNFFIMTF